MYFSTPTVSVQRVRQSAFSLIEVILAIGIFLVTVLALVGLLGPTLKSVDNVERTDEVASVVTAVNAFLQSSPDIAPGASKFDAIYNAVGSSQYATLFVFREYVDGTSTDIRLKIGFEESETSIDPLAQVTNFSNAAGTIYRVILTPSAALPTPTANPTLYRSTNRVASTGTYTLNATLANYLEGSFPMEVRIYAEDPGPNFNPANLPPDYSTAFTLAGLSTIEPFFTYNTAIVR